MWEDSNHLNFKKKQELLSLFKSNTSGDRVHTSSRPSEYYEVNKALYEWYKITCSKNIYPGGPQLTQKAKDIVEQLEKSISQVLGAGLTNGRRDTTSGVWRIW